MIGKARCFGAATIVNAIATGKGAAFGVSLKADAEVEMAEAEDPVKVDTDAGLDSTLVRRCIEIGVERLIGKKLGARVIVKSEIPPSRGLKSSSTVANAVVLATRRALGVFAPDEVLVNIGVDAALDSGVTITGAFDDACASFFGGVVLTNNRTRRIMAGGAIPQDLKAVLQIPGRQISKNSLKDLDFSIIAPEAEEAFRLALRGDIYSAMDLNGRAYAKLLGIDDAPARKAKTAGALSAGLSGTGPAFVALCKSGDAEAVARVLQDDEVTVRVVDVNNTKASDVIP